MKKKKIILVMLASIITLGIILYNPLIEYLSEQAANPQGFIGKIITKVWSSYFDDLSEWTINYTEVKDDSKVLDIGYGGGSNIKNLVNLNQSLDIYGVDISEESFKTASNLNKQAINNGYVKLSIGDVADMSYQDNFFDLVFAIQTHMYWDDLKKGFEETYRVMSDNSVLIISSEKDKIDYHMDSYKTTESLTTLLKDIGFTEIIEKENGNWIFYTVYKKAVN